MGPNAKVPLQSDKTPRGDEAFRLLVDSVADYAIFLLATDGTVVTWNEGAYRIKGYRAEEIIGKHFSQFYPSESRQSGWPERELEIAVAEGKFIDEGWRVRKDGTTFWANVVITALRGPDGELKGFAKVTRDMTERREREEKILQLNSELRARITQLAESQKLVELRTVELNNLSARLLQLQDQERRRIARELHDALGQDLAALKMTLETGARNTEQLKGAVAEATTIADSAIKSVRNISYLLHPPLLDETGLVSALHWFVEGFQKRSGIQVQLGTRPSDFPRCPQEIETTVFRIVQESLNNVYRHSGSTVAQVEVESQKDQIVLKIRDYGKGLPAGAPSLKSGAGLAGMRERVKQFGGDFHISAEQPGTLIRATIPLYRMAAEI